MVRISAPEQGILTNHKFESGGPVVARVFFFVNYLCAMQRILLLFVAIALHTASCTGDRDYNPDKHLTVQQQDLLMDRIIRYIARAPEGVTPEERFNRSYDEHYDDQRRRHRLDALYADDHTYYFLVSRVAPSLTEKRLAIGGKVEMDENQRITYYEESFRTWKMEPDTLIKRSLFLFDRMVRGENLEPYYSSRSGNTDYIEFPDDRTYFDTEKRIWRTK